MNHDDSCRCGHDRDAHEHYRLGTDCSLCTTCPSFRTQAARPVASGPRFRPAVLPE